jgi:hypothetical protein
VEEQVRKKKERKRKILGSGRASKKGKVRANGKKK